MGLHGFLVGVATLEALNIVEVVVAINYLNQNIAFWKILLSFWGFEMAKLVFDFLFEYLSRKYLCYQVITFSFLSFFEFLEALVYISYTSEELNWKFFIGIAGAQLGMRMALKYIPVLRKEETDRKVDFFVFLLTFFSLQSLLVSDILLGFTSAGSPFQRIDFQSINAVMLGFSVMYNNCGGMDNIAKNKNPLQRTEGKLFYTLLGWIMIGLFITQFVYVVSYIQSGPNTYYDLVICWLIVSQTIVCCSCSCCSGIVFALEQQQQQEQTSTEMVPANTTRV